MSNQEEHHHETPKRVYFGIPFGFAFAFWFIIFLCLKACDGPKTGCCKEGEVCSKECKAKCEAEGKTDCAHTEGKVTEGKKETSPESVTPEEKNETHTEEQIQKPSEENAKPAEEKK